VPPFAPLVPLVPPKSLELSDALAPQPITAVNTPNAQTYRNPILACAMPTIMKARLKRRNAIDSVGRFAYGSPGSGWISLVIFRSLFWLVRRGYGDVVAGACQLDGKNPGFSQWFALGRCGR
jgi:hypothetical protein